MNQPPKTKFALGDYVEVAPRIQAWYEAHPEGRIETDIVEHTDTRVVTVSRCYRTSDPTERPAGIGHSVLAIPGKTSYTRDSELENCETSSVGRALVMAGVPAKQIASASEIRNKQSGEQPKPPATTKATSQTIPGDSAERITNPVLLAREAIQNAPDYETGMKYLERSLQRIEEGAGEWKSPGDILALASQVLPDLATDQEQLATLERLLLARLDDFSRVKFQERCEKRADSFSVPA